MVSLFWRFFWHQLGLWWWLKSEDQTHISSRGILQQPKVFVLDETFFCLKNLDRMLLHASFSLLLRSNLLLHLSFDLFIEQKTSNSRLTWRNWLVRVAAIAYFLYRVCIEKNLIVVMFPLKYNE